MSVTGRGGRVWLLGILWAMQSGAQEFTISTIVGGAPPPTPVSGTTASIGLLLAVATDTYGNLYLSNASACVFKLDTAGVLTLVAGNSRSGYAGDGGPATSAELASPMGLAVDRSGNLYIADSNNHRIRRVSPDGVITTLAGTGVEGYSGDGGPAASAQLKDPTGVAVDDAGNLYIADRMNHRIRRVSAAGIISTVAGTGAQGFSGDGGLATSATFRYPQNVAVDGVNNLYIADNSNNRVRRMSPDGIITTVATVNSPRALAVTSAGDLFIADTFGYHIDVVSRSGNGRIVAGTGQEGFSGDGGPATLAQISEVLALALDGAGSLFIADSYNFRIRRVSAGSAIISTVAGNGFDWYSGDGGAAKDAQIEPGGIALSESGVLYIAESLNRRVRKVSPSGVITTVAGTGVEGSSGDGGPAAAAQLRSPVDVALDRAGNLFIVDSSDHRVRRVAPDGAITAFAGTGTEGYDGDGGPARSAQLRAPRAVATDSAGNVYIADYSGYRIRRVSPSGVIDTIAGNGSYFASGDGDLATKAGLQAAALTVDEQGNIYLADMNNHRIRRIGSNGIITTVAGNGAPGFSGDGGPATSAQLHLPGGVGVDNSGNLYITDGHNYRVRRVVPTGVITTIAGNGGDSYTGDGGLATSAQVTPLALELDSAGRVYLSSPRSIRLLTPICNVSASPAAVAAPAGGGALALTIVASVGCGWTVTSLPPWITASNASGSGPATVTLTVAANPGAPRSVIITAAGTAVTITQGAALSMSCVPGLGPVVVGAMCLETCSASGGEAPYHWSISTGALPAGLALSLTEGATVSISGRPSVSGPYAFTLSVIDAEKPPLDATRSFSGTLPYQQFRVVNAASYLEGTVAPDSIASLFGGSLALYTETYDGSVVTTLGGATVRMTSRDAQMFYASSRQINFLIPAGAVPGVAGITLNKSGVLGVLVGSALVADVAPGIFVVSGSSAVPAAFYLRVTPANERIQDYTFNPATLEAVPIPRNAGDAIYVLLYGTGFRRHRGNVTATANRQPVPVLGAVAQSQYAGLDQVNIGPLPANLASGLVTVHLEFDGVPANDVTVRLQ